MSASTITTARAPALRTRDLAVGYRTRWQRRAVLERVNLTVEPGELVCLLGPNGIGKSLMRRWPGCSRHCGLWNWADGARVVVSLRSCATPGVVLTERVAVESLRARQVIELGRYPHSGWWAV